MECRKVLLTMSEILNEDTSGSSTTQSEQPLSAGSVEVPSYLPRQTMRQLLRVDLGFIPVLITLIVIVTFFAIATSGIFLSPRNFSELMQEIATIGSLGLGFFQVEDGIRNLTVTGVQTCALPV